jgi:hypothetical protein
VDVCTDFVVTSTLPNALAYVAEEPTVITKAAALFQAASFPTPSTVGDVVTAAETSDVTGTGVTDFLSSLQPSIKKKSAENSAA